MKKDRLVYLLIIILVIWNVILTTVLIKNYNSNKGNDIQIVENNIQGFSTDLSEVVKKCKSSIVTVETDSSLLSGLIYAQDQDNLYVVSCYHGINDSSFIRVILDSGKELEGIVKGYDIYSDICVIEVKTDLMVTPVELGDNSLLKSGEFVITMGTPKSKDYSQSSALAMVSNKLRTISNSITVDNESYDYYIDVIQLDSNVTNGFSGSPVFNMIGQVEGIITMKDDVATFVAPINEIKIIADNIINSNDYIKIPLGVKGEYIASLESYQKNQLDIPLDVITGYYVKNVKLNSLANAADVKPGDIIESVNNIVINNDKDLLSIEYSNERTFEFKIIRNNEELTLLGSVSD